MPCTDTIPNEDNHRYQNLEKQIEDLKKQNRYYEGISCALINELENRDIAYDVISNASKKGNVNIFNFWEEHTKEDYIRIAKKINSVFSNDETKVVLDILIKRNLENR